jgi:hypothetical protein
MSTLDQIATARNDAFASRVLMISMKTAETVSNEDPATVNHAERLKYAQRTMRGDENSKMLATHIIANNATIQAAIDSDPASLGSNVADADIQTTMTTIWTARSLAFAAT